MAGVFCFDLRYWSGHSPGKSCAIRAETDKEVIKHFSDDQRRIWREWRNKSAKQKSPEEVQNYLEMFKAAFVRMAGDSGG